MKSILQVFSFDLISKVLIGIIGILLIRYMEPSQFALYTFLLSIISVIAQSLANLFKRVYIVGYNKLSMDKPMESFLGFQILIIFGLALVFLVFSRKLDTIIVISMVFGITLLEFAKTVYQQELNFKRYSMIEIIRSISFFLMTLILIYISQDRISAGQVLFIQSSTMIVITCFYLWNKIDFSNIFKYEKIIQVGKIIINRRYKFLIGYVIFSTMLAQLDIFMLKLLSDDYELANYGSAFRYYTLLLLALSSVNAVFLPVIQTINTRNELNKIYKKHYRLLCFFVPVILIGAWLSNWIFPIIDMGKYPDASTVFQVLSFSAIISLALSPHTNFVMKYEDFKFLFFVILIAFIANVALNLILISLYGSIGAAIATLFTFGFSNLMTYFRSKKHKKSLPITLE